LAIAGDVSANANAITANVERNFMPSLYPIRHPDIRSSRRESHAILQELRELTHELKLRAIDEGFDLVGVAAADRAMSLEHLDRWLDTGLHAGMSYMASHRELRSDPRLLLPGCRSVVAVAMSYHTSLPPSRLSSRDGEPRVWVSRYAWGRDYHKVMKAKLVRLGRWLVGRRPNAKWRACVDTAPLLEREWAARAGLGWIGKNTMLLNRKLGSELFLGFLLTDVELGPDPSTSDHCGRCTKCLDACPTRSFPMPRVLDASRCVGYLTVEHRTAIPAALHREIGVMVSGCDICQEVCPWTLRAPADLHGEFSPHPRRFQPLFDELDHLDEDDFRRWRAGSALTRIPYLHFRRILAIVRVNLGL
jgi:epoxyqueuosine reductase